MMTPNAQPTNFQTGNRFTISASDPVRIPDPRKISYQYLQSIFAEVQNASTETLLQIRENTYEVLDRMDEIYLNGGQISAEQVDDIIRGIAVVEEVLIKKMNGKKINTLSSRLDL